MMGFWTRIVLTALVVVLVTAACSLLAPHMGWSATETKIQVAQTLAIIAYLQAITERK